MSSNDTRAGRSRCVSEAAEQNDLVDPTSNAKESGGSMSEVTTEKLLADFRVLIDDVEQLVSATAGEAGGRVAELRQHLAGRLEAGKAAVAQCEKELREQAQRAKSRAADFLRDEGWCWLAVAGCLGMLAGLALYCQSREFRRRENPPDQRDTA